MPLALAAISAAALGVVLLQHRAHPNDPHVNKARALAAAVTAGLLALGIARWIGPVWGTVTLALAGLAWTALGVQAGHSVLRVIGLGALAVAGVTVLVTTLLPYSLVRTDPLILNRINYGFCVPLACVAGGLALFMRAAESKQTPAAKRVLGPLVVLGVFAWLNVLIVQATTEGEHVLFVMHRITGRDLSMSLGWTVYSLVLLGLGTAGRVSGLRWMSLGITLLTVGKVFLYDLGHLQGLYRVGSLAGLAICLLLVSFLYQRFVFRQTEAVGDSA